MFNLFGRLTQDAFELDNLLQELEGDVSDQVVQDWITRHDKNENDLLNAAVGVVKEYETMAIVYDEELKRLRERRVSYETKIASIKKMVIEYLIKIGKTKADTGLYSLTVASNGGLAPLVIADELITNPKSSPFFKEKPEVDNKLIRDFFTEGRRKEFELKDQISFLSEGVEKNTRVYDVILVEETGEQELREIDFVPVPVDSLEDLQEDNPPVKILGRVIATLKPRGVNLRIK